MQWKKEIQALQAQIDTLTAWQRCAATDSDGGTSDSPQAEDSATRLEMPPDHPLYPFVIECLAQRSWASRAPCGAVRRAYVKWSSARAAKGQKKMHHLQFSAELRKYWVRKGSQTRAYYERLELLPGAIASPRAIDTVAAMGLPSPAASEESK